MDQYVSICLLGSEEKIVLFSETVRLSLFLMVAIIICKNYLLSTKNYIFFTFNLGCKPTIIEIHLNNFVQRCLNNAWQLSRYNLGYKPTIIEIYSNNFGECMAIVKMWDGCLSEKCIIIAKICEDYLDDFYSNDIQCSFKTPHSHHLVLKKLITYKKKKP